MSGKERKEKFEEERLRSKTGLKGLETFSR
jgi:hypothetical protein